MRFRPAKNSDREAVEELVFTILDSYGLKADPEATDADLAALEGAYGENGGSFELLVDDDGRIVGTVGIHRTTADLCELRKMYLDPEFRGQGLGRRLLDRGLEKAQVLGFRRIWLETAESLEEAGRLYRRYGFEPWDPPHRSARCDLSMVRDL